MLGLHLDHHMIPESVYCFLIFLNILRRSFAHKFRVIVTCCYTAVCGVPMCYMKIHLTSKCWKVFKVSDHFGTLCIKGFKYGATPKEIR